MTREDAYALGNIIHQEVITFYESQFNEIFKKCNIYPQYRSFRGNTDIRSKLINLIYNDHEAQLEAKDKKARRIVAMLFWEWRKDKRIYENANKYTKETAELYVNCSELSFKKAYAMLKAN